MIYVKINGTEYEAEVAGRLFERDFGGRESKAITTRELTAAEAMELFRDDTPWSIVERVWVEDEETHERHEEVTEWDNSAYSVAGDVTDHRDGRVTVKMGKPTDLELAYEELYG